MQNDFVASSEGLIRDIIEKQQVDILFECFVGLLMKCEEFNASDVHIIPKDNVRRGYKNDITPIQEESESISKSYFEKIGQQILLICTSRASILDYLPEDFYAEPDNTKEIWNENGEKKSEEEIIKYREQVKEDYENALRFFRPLEVEYNKLRIAREYREVDSLENLDKVLESFWDELSVTNDKWRRFVKTLHLVPFVVGDAGKTKALIEFVLNSTVNLSFSTEAYYSMNKKERDRLFGKEEILGFNVNLGNRIYDYLEVCTLKLEKLSSTSFFEYQDPKSEHRKLLETIKDYYFPLNTEVRLDFSIEEGEKDPDKPYIGILGYSAKLGQ